MDTLWIILLALISSLIAGVIIGLKLEFIVLLMVNVVVYVVCDFLVKSDSILISTAAFLLWIGLVAGCILGFAGSFLSVF